MVVRPLFPRAFVGSVVMRGGVQRWGLIGFAGSGETGDRSRFPLATRSLVRCADRALLAEVMIKAANCHPTN